MIETHHLTRHFGHHAAVEDLNLRVESGELFAFLGPNGAGKSTTLRMLVGLLRPTAGTALVAGRDIQGRPQEARRAVGYMAEESILYEKLSGMEFLHFIGGLYGLPDGEIAARARRLMELLDLNDKAGETIQGYSHGMRQKIALSAALLHEPGVLLLDEPFSGLDPRSARLVKDVLRAFCRQGGTVLLSTHTLEIAERMCDRIGILHQGRLIATGSMQDLRRQAHTSEQATLEDLFLQLTGGQAVAEVAAVLGVESEGR